MNTNHNIACSQVIKTCVDNKKWNQNMYKLVNDLICNPTSDAKYQILS